MTRRCVAIPKGALAKMPEDEFNGLAMTKPHAVQVRQARDGFEAPPNAVSG
jgi:hypothetical protein